MQFFAAFWVARFSGNSTMAGRHVFPGWSRLSFLPWDIVPSLVVSSGALGFCIFTHVWSFLEMVGVVDGGWDLCIWYMLIFAAAISPALGW